MIPAPSIYFFVKERNRVVEDDAAIDFGAAQFANPLSPGDEDPLPEQPDAIVAENSAPTTTDRRLVIVMLLALTLDSNTRVPSQATDNPIGVTDIV